MNNANNIGSDVFIKICGISRAEEAKAIADLGVDAIGMILHAKSPRLISLRTAQSIRKVVPENVKLVGVVVNASQQTIEDLVDHIQLDMVQLHGDETPDFADQLLVPYIKALRPRSKTQALNEAAAFSNAQAILLDPYVKDQYGGTGHTLDTDLWPQGALKPLILAGGLDADNVVQKVRELSPYGVDMNSGLELRAGRKNIPEVARAVKQLRALK